MNYNRQKKIIILMAFITVVSVSITIWLLFFNNQKLEELSPDYPPLEEEDNAEKIDGNDDEKIAVSEGGGAVNMTYQKDVTISLKDSVVHLMFQNPSKSVNNITLQLVVTDPNGKDIVIAKSGIIAPGYKLTKLNIIKDSVKLKKGDYLGKFVLHYYDPDTNEKAIINSKIEGIKIKVAN